ncbi:hypothetical protein AWH48_01065 [Domibacillus aminovorans]|uniref:Uncharacterized protein n=1 Tax=Domibacillus aminovorans TaxID=29332 RepID=A0A177KWA2_9BACI|nr:hypothetical protein [Domibacillus aminovorans]OAH57638.1 hypothetical protein AWH48_01065 [Domibacillus aminovorans]
MAEEIVAEAHKVCPYAQATFPCGEEFYCFWSNVEVYASDPNGGRAFFTLKINENPYETVLAKGGNYDPEVHDQLVAEAAAERFGITAEEALEIYTNIAFENAN